MWVYVCVCVCARARLEQSLRSRVSLYNYLSLLNCRVRIHRLKRHVETNHEISNPSHTVIMQQPVILSSPYQKDAFDF